MASIFDCALYVLERTGETTTMKMQKLAYYCQAWSLAWDEEPLFPEDFQAWANGPVCPELFARHKGRFKIDAGALPDANAGAFTSNQKESMDIVLGHYGGMTPFELSELTHMERPWRETRAGVAPGDPCERVIPKQLMQEYYSGLA